MRKAGVFFACALLVAPAMKAASQTRQLEARLDSLARIATHARAALRAYDDSVRRVGATLDTAFAGAVIVVAERPVALQLRAIAPAVVDSVRRIVGAAMSRLDGYSFRAHVDHHVERRTGDTTHELTMRAIRPDGSQLHAWRSPVDSASIATSLFYAIRHTAFASADPDFFAWSGSAIPGDTMRPSDWANARLALVSSPTAVGSRCFRGDVPACKSLLSLTATSDPIRSWHDSTTRRRLVRRHGALARRLDPSAERRCLAGVDTSCVSLLESFPPGALREPAAIVLRFGLLRHALGSGGAGSVERMLSADADHPAARLEAAAQVPIDSLVSSWQARVRDTRAPSEDLTVGITIMSLAWATAIGALSLRSSRWR